MKKKQNKGFTLIELLVVVSIIGVLATIVLSSLNKARIRAQDTAHLTLAKGVRDALELYYLDNGEYPFPIQPGNITISTCPSRNVGAFEWSDFVSALSPYIDLTQTLAYDCASPRGFGYAVNTAPGPDAIVCFDNYYSYGDGYCLVWTHRELESKPYYIYDHNNNGFVSKIHNLSQPK